MKEEGGRAFQKERLAKAQKFLLVQEAAGLEVAGGDAGEESREWLEFMEYEAFVSHCRKFGLNTKVGENREQGAIRRRETSQRP